jgi:cobalt-zinc-cadmium efflux system protein
MDYAPPQTKARHTTLLTVAGLTFGFLIVEIVFGLITNSLALLADAVHMFTDSGALALSAFAAWMAQRPATPEKSYGYYRFEILTALANSVILMLSALYILYEAYQRFRAPPEVIGLPMMAVAFLGLIVNLIGIVMLHRDADQNLNMQGAFYEVIKDALGSVGVVVAGVVILTTGWPYADPIASALIAIFILPRTWQLMSKAVDILLEATPARIDAQEVKQIIKAVDGVDLVHDLHIWSITSELISLSAHVSLERVSVSGRSGYFCPKCQKKSPSND